MLSTPKPFWSDWSVSTETRSVVTVRPASLKDVDLITEIRNEGSSSTEFIPPTNNDQVKQFLEGIALLPKGYGFILIGSIDNKPVGVLYCGQHGTNLDTFHLACLIVVEQYRGAGVGSALMSDAIMRAKKARFKYVSISVDKLNPKAELLYSRMGFKKIGETHIADETGEDYDVHNLRLTL